MKSKKLSIIIPAYNEAERITPALLSAVAYLEKQPYTYEIIVVNDGSTDMTKEVVSAFVDANEKISLQSYKTNRGKGYAVNFGMSVATGDYMLYIDADNAISIDHLDVFLPKLKEGSDVVIGSIELPGHVAEDNNEWYRRALGRFAKKLIWVMATPGIYDTQRAFKLFTREAARNIFSRQTIERWGFDIELMVIAKKHRYSITELPVTWINPDGSSVEGLKTYILTFMELGEIVWKSLRGFYRPSSFIVWRKERAFLTPQKSV